MFNMVQDSIMNIHLKGAEHSVNFRYCSPGHFRIRNNPKLAAKNTIVKFSKGFWMQETTVSLGLYESNSKDYEYSQFLKRVDKARKIMLAV